MKDECISEFGVGIHDYGSVEFDYDNNTTIYSCVKCGHQTFEKWEIVNDKR